MHPYTALLLHLYPGVRDDHGDALRDLVKDIMEARDMQRYLAGEPGCIVPLGEALGAATDTSGAASSGAAMFPIGGAATFATGGIGDREGILAVAKGYSRDVKNGFEAHCCTVSTENVMGVYQSAGTLWLLSRAVASTSSSRRRLHSSVVSAGGKASNHIAWGSSLVLKFYH